MKSAMVLLCGAVAAGCGGAQSSVVEESSNASASRVIGEPADHSLAGRAIVALAVGDNPSGPVPTARRR